MQKMERQNHLQEHLKQNLKQNLKAKEQSEKTDERGVNKHGDDIEIKHIPPFKYLGSLRMFLFLRKRYFNSARMHLID